MEKERLKEHRNDQQSPIVPDSCMARLKCCPFERKECVLKKKMTDFRDTILGTHSVFFPPIMTQQVCFLLRRFPQHSCMHSCRDTPFPKGPLLNPRRTNDFYDLIYVFFRDVCPICGSINAKGNRFRLYFLRENKHSSFLFAFAPGVQSL